MGKQEAFLTEEELLFRVLFASVYALFAGVRFYYRAETIGRKSEKTIERVDKAGIALSLAILGYLTLVVLYLLIPDLISWAHIDLPTLARWTGLGLAVVGILLTLLAHRALGKQCSARQEIQKGHQLISK